MAEPAGARFIPGRRLSLTPRILIINLLPLLLLGGGVFYLDSYRKQLLQERYKLARIEAQITAEALAGASRERQEALLIQIGKEQHMRLRMFDAQGHLWADSFKLDKPSFAFDKPGDETWQENLARWMDRAVDTIVGADPIPDYNGDDRPSTIPNFSLPSGPIPHRASKLRKMRFPTNVGIFPTPNPTSVSRTRGAPGLVRTSISCASGAPGAGSMARSCTRPMASICANIGAWMSCWK